MTYEHIPKLIRAAINNDKKSLELIARTISRKIKKEDPASSNEILKILSCLNTGTDVFRSIDISPLPVDTETRQNLLKIEEPLFIDKPIFEDKIYDEIGDFIIERNYIDKFLEKNIKPSNSILLYGKPGVGKTYLAKWLAFKLNMPIVTLDLANSISSYLGRSGQNIKTIFEYSKEHNVILFLDEMDAIAKRRDDISDLGELKRLVNVLLKELEDCPIRCIIVGATNYPELLDKAIWRRFDRNIEITIPKEEQRKLLFKRGLNDFLSEIDDSIMYMLINSSNGKSAADICKICDHIKRKKILYPSLSINMCILKEYCKYINFDTKKEKTEICKNLKMYNTKLTIKNISELTGISQSSVDRYLKEI